LKLGEEKLHTPYIQLLRRDFFYRHHLSYIKNPNANLNKTQ